MCVGGKPRSTARHESKVNRRAPTSGASHCIIPCQYICRQYLISSGEGSDGWAMDGSCSAIDSVIEPRPRPSLLRVGGGRSRSPTRLSWKVGHFDAKNSGCVSGKSRVWSIHRRGSFRLLVIRVTDGLLVWSFQDERNVQKMVQKLDLSSYKYFSTR